MSRGSYRDDALARLDVRMFAERQGVALGKKVGTDEYRFLCQFHGDTEPSANWNIRTGLWHCQACGAAGSPIDFLMQRDGLDYKAALTMVGDLAGLPPPGQYTNGAAGKSTPSPNHKPKPGPAARTRKFEAIDTAGRAWLHTRREDATGRSLGPMTWQPGVKVADLLPYGSELVATWPADDPLFLVEGEATAEALRAAGLPALGTFGVAYKPVPDALTALTGRKVILWPDADDVGRAHMLDMAERLTNVAAALRWIEPPADAFKGWDAADADSDTIARLVSEAGPIPAPEPNADSFTLAMLDRTPPPPLLLDRLDPLESTILYGPGGVGKGTLTVRWIVDLVTIREVRVLVLDYENHGPEWARRVFGLAGVDVLSSVEWRAPLAEARGPIWDHADWIRDTCARLGIGYVVIDSAIMACGGQDPLKPETPGHFNAAIQQLGLPSLTLAHVTKLHDARYPFGSVFWHNLARVTWSLMPKGEDIILTCRKANNYLKPSPQAITTTWHEGALGEVSERPAMFSLLDRLADALDDGEPKTVSQLAALLNDGLDASEHTSSNAIRAVFSRDLTRNGKASRFTIDGAKRWSLRSTDET